MSTIWAAEDRQLQRSVAIKLLTTTMADRDGVRRRFEREAMAVARLQSPHIVQVFDYGIDEGTPAIVMELLHGEDLRKRLKGKRKLPLRAVLEIVKQCANGLGEAHAAGIIHRDLKPGNIFLSRDRQQGVVLKILDFGVAKGDSALPSTGNTTKAGEIIGTPHFMSPEQARAKDPIDHRTDLWSLGVIIYRMLCGRLPFDGHNPPQILIAAATENFQPPSVFVPELPRSIDDFMRHALCRDRDRRFSSAAEMAEALTAIYETSKMMRAIVDERSNDDLTTMQASGTVQMHLPRVNLPTEDLSALAPPTSDLPSEPPMPTLPSDLDIAAGTDPSHGSLGNAMLSSPAPEPQKNPLRSMATMVGAALLLGLVFAGVVAWSQRTSNPEPPQPAAAEVPPAPEPTPTPPPATAPPAPPPTPRVAAAPPPTASVAPQPSTPATPAPAPRPQSIAPRPRPQPAVTPRPRPTKGGTDPWGSRF